MPSFRKKADGYPVFPAYVTLYVGATDKVTGNEKLLVSVNNARPANYTGQIKGFNTDDLNVVKITAVDMVGNERTHIVKFYVE